MASISDLSTICQQDISAETRIALGQTLPLRVQKGIATRAVKEYSINDASRMNNYRDEKGDRRIEAALNSGSLFKIGKTDHVDDIELKIRSAASTDAGIRAFWSTLSQRGANGIDSNYLANLLKPTLSAVVAPAAFGQAIIGVLTAGPAKATKYAAAKLTKVFKLITRR